MSGLGSLGSQNNRGRTPRKERHLRQAGALARAVMDVKHTFHDTYCPEAPARTGWRKGRAQCETPHRRVYWLSQRPTGKTETSEPRKGGENRKAWALRQGEIYKGVRAPRESQADRGRSQLALGEIQREEGLIGKEPEGEK